MVHQLNANRETGIAERLFDANILADRYIVIGQDDFSCRAKRGRSFC